MPDSPEKLDLRSMDIAADKRRLLRRVFPEVFTESIGPEGKPAELDFERLKAVLGAHVAIADPQAEKYGLDWPGKRDALAAVQTPALGTLVPCPEESVDWDTTRNVFIEGDNLEVLKLLQKSYCGKVKMIYIEDRIDTALIDAVAGRHPVQFICLDRALSGSDALKVNALETFRACQPEIQFRTV